MKPQVMSAKVDLHYSPDDEGWYFQHYDVPNQISQTFPSKAQALTAWHEHLIKWHKL